ncbi:MAG TPA: hypothetical protein VFJ19_12350 [Nocardioidaceae bacterium]|nr:hypothetical protein [Nocardioidaceae bacterium]
MSELGFYYDRLAAQRIEEHLARSRQPHLPRPPRPRGRHALATRLHHIANRIDN